MKLFKPTYKDKKTGKTKTCKKWYLEFKDNSDNRHRLPLFSRKKPSQEAMDNIGELICGKMEPSLIAWIKELPPRIQDRLLEAKVFDGSILDEAPAVISLSEHLEDFCDGLEADNRTDSYVRQVRTTIAMILDGCKFRTWSNIDGNKVKTFLAKSRGDDGYGERTYNNHLRSFKEFCKWLTQEDRVVGSDPMKNHKLIKQEEFRKQRRALTVDEMHRLLKATEAAPAHSNMSGHERSLVYRLALETGLRAGEIKSLRVLSFDFESQYPTVHVKPSDTKGKKPADMTLMSATANAIKEHFGGKNPKDKAFGMPHKANTAKMIREDLKKAKIPYTDDSGKDCDFHALRHTFGTNLALAGVHPAVAQKLMRHSSVELTMKLYTHVLHGSEVAAIDSLKNLTQVPVFYDVKVAIAV